MHPRGTCQRRQGNNVRVWWRAGADPANVKLSGRTADNAFSGPDGPWLSRASNLCWIQTDDGACAQVTNCMRLGAIPGAVNIASPSACPSYWPDGGMARPRSATIVFTKKDEGTIRIWPGTRGT